MGSAIKKTLALLLCATVGWTAPAPTGANCHGGATTSASTTACTASMTVSVGDIIVCSVIGDTNRTLSSITNTGAAVTWTRVAGLHLNDATQDEFIDGGWGIATGAGAMTPTANYSAACTFRGFYCEAFSGGQGATDGSITTQSAGSTATNGVVSGNITTTVNGDLLVGMVAQVDGITATITAGTVSQAFTKLSCMTDSSNNICMEWAVQTTAAASTAADWTFNTSHRALANILAVKAAAGGAATSGFSKRDKITKMGVL